MPMRREGRALVITDPTLLVRRSNERLVMLRDGKEVAAIPLREVSHVALHGPVTLTGAAVAGVLDAGIDVTLHSSAGQLRGVMSSAQSGNVFLVLAQAAAWTDVGKRLAFARPVVAGKLLGQRDLLLRAAIDRGSSCCRDAVRQIDALMRGVDAAADVDALRGFEGAASAAYFGAFGELLSGDWTFPGRVRRPPTDPVNALLSFGYTLAVGELARLALWSGFDPRIGLLHGIRYGRESLPLDLVEELRAPMVDRFTLRLLNLRQLGPTDFETRDDGACRLTADARVRYLTAWEEMMVATAPKVRNEAPDTDPADRPAFLRLGRDVEPDGAIEAGAVSWRFRMERQLHRLQRFLLRGAAYHPLHMRRGRSATAPPSETGSHVAPPSRKPSKSQSDPDGGA